jgi:hypothetical protein
MSWRSDITPHPTPLHLEEHADRTQAIAPVGRPVGEPHAGWGALFVLVAIVALALILGVGHP